MPAAHAYWRASPEAEILKDGTGRVDFGQSIALRIETLRYILHKQPSAMTLSARREMRRINSRR